MQEPKVQFGTADSADFEKLTWTFTMDGNLRVQGGLHAIMTESEYRRLLDMPRVKDAKLGDMLKMAYCQKVGSDTPHGLDCCDDYIDWLKSLQMPNGFKN